MKKLLLTILLMAPLGAYAGDQSILFEVGIGIGSSGAKTNGSDEARWCKNRNTGRLLFGALRYRYDNYEVHGARWSHNDSSICNRDMWAVGAGYRFTTEGDGIAGDDDVHASWTTGIAYAWGDDNDFRGKSASRTNWRNTNNWQPFNRVAVGAGFQDVDVEVALHRYGAFNPLNGEAFATVGLALKDLEDNRPQSSNGVISTTTTTDTGEDDGTNSNDTIPLSTDTTDENDDTSGDTDNTDADTDGDGSGGNGTGGTGDNGTGNGQGNDNGDGDTTSGNNGQNGDNNSGGVGNDNGNGRGNNKNDMKDGVADGNAGKGNNKGNKNDMKDGVIDGNAGKGNNK